jgi:uncharacterized protein YchJ
MNRTREYTKIVQTSSMPQKSTSNIESPFLEIFSIDKRIKLLLSDITKCKYEIYSIRSKVSEVQILCKDALHRLKLCDMEFSNTQEGEVYITLQNIIRNRINEYKLEIMKYLRKCEKVECETEQRRNKFSHSDASSAALAQEVVMEEAGVRMRNRQEISRQISEIGSIMEEIGIHVSLQEESFKRIDDLMGKSDKLMDNSLYILKKGIEGVAGTRRSLIKFFVFWIVLALIFWMFRLR